ncbi:unnamed protein product [Acanthoscelides obtectus]|uniref:Uncharacterized protein n=1 Tax=Acanthoscelides obtectus TaxID=200917 RepID=A0A9P0PCZ9_ACAOB|nr:unnamed protein product [Acanthoscelides obtectus]CAK1664800.1 hypothetical protein AOBTE_LOCUS24472 [Acanthoscelides obtectus]
MCKMQIVWNCQSAVFKLPKSVTLILFYYIYYSAEILNLLIVELF